MDDHESDFRTEPTQLEMAKLENALLQAEYKYGKDILTLEGALIRARKMGILHLVGLHLRMVFVTELSKVIPLERAIYKWKSLCVTNNAARNNKFKMILKSLYKTTITRAFYILKERRFRRSMSEKPVEGPVYAHGAMSPLSSEDDDLEI
jgi:hypothetical protein